MAFGFFAHVVGQCAAAALAFWDHNFGPEPRQEPDCGVVDIGVERPLRTAGHQRHTHLFIRHMECLRVVVA